ncbi:MAG TPA: heparan-alpha-glucosaminide N-acetyltransferase domain-containing protein, partial [Methanoregula sp.]|nr:heparan-alpha-glucosaminide N-acetyltransferase domain-containing protein [Methanoregula sp.]
MMVTASGSAPVRLPVFRDIPVDIVRGFAIASLVMANMTPALLLPPAPLWFRVIASLAAPAFVIVAGMMVALSLNGKNRPFSYVLIRGSLTLVVAALIDIFLLKWIPFCTMDVLYLIGLSLPCAWLYLMLPDKRRWSIILAILCATPILQGMFGYAMLAPEIPVGTLWGAGNPAIPIPPLSVIIHAWFLDGYFPVFPWLAFSLFGAELGTYRWRARPAIPFRVGREGLAALGLLLAGGFAWVIFPGPHVIRSGYVELFYPPTIGFFIAMAGFIVLLLTLLDSRETLPWSGFLVAMGEGSLFLY